MKVQRRYVTALLALTLSCGGGATSADNETDGVGSGGSVSTGLEGTAYRSPTRPVCRIDEPCRAPFNASFDVQQAGQVVAGFQSDADGRFLVLLAPGTYTVMPDASAPLLTRGQPHEVNVGPSGLTHVDLDFDTGIR